MKQKGTLDLTIKTIIIYIGSCSQTTLTLFWLFLTIYPPALTFSNIGKKWTFLDHLPTLSWNVVCEQHFDLNWLFTKLLLRECFFTAMIFYSRANWKNFVNWGMNTTLWISESRESRLFVLLGLLAVLSEVFLVG